ncbi:MAG: hypothetical protein RLZZ301_914 [Bacteroidota bacterium]|jgi:O-antigen/teichoic acid export membrane protein
MSTSSARQLKERSFYSNLFFSLGLNLIVKPVAIFAIDAAVQKEVGAEYGLYFAFFNLSLILSIVFDLGINNLSIKTAAQEMEQAKSRFTSILYLRFLLMLLFIFGLLGSAFFLKLTWDTYKLLLILGLNQFLIANIAFFRSYFAGLHWFRLDALFSVLDRLLLIFSMGYLIYLYPDGNKMVHIDTYAFFQFACYGLSFVVSGLTLLFVVKPPFKLPSIRSLLPVIRQAFPYALLIVLMTLYTRSDALLLLHYSRPYIGAQEVSNYARAFRIIDALYMFAMVFAGLLFPMFAKMIAHKPAEIAPLLSKSSKLLLGSSIAFIMFTFVHGDLIMGLIYGPSVEYQVSSIDSLCFLSIAFFGMASNLIYGSLLTANGSLKALNTISFIGVLINVSLNVIVLPQMHFAHAVGAASSAAITQLIVAAAQAIYCKRLFQLPLFDTNTILRYGLLLLGFFFWYLSHWFTPLGQLAANKLALLNAAFSLLLLLALKFIDISELRKMLQSRSDLK